MDQIAILMPLVAGITATVFTIVIHSLALTAVIGFVRPLASHLRFFAQPVRPHPA